MCPEHFSRGDTYMKIIEGFPNYAVTRSGKVINVRNGRERIPSNNHTGRGYLYVDLYNRGSHKKFYIHRLVAMSFIDNPENKPYVNHIDGNTMNNSVSNLEWCTPLENVEHAANVLSVMPQYWMANQKRKMAVDCYDCASGRLIKRYSSICDASRDTGIPSSNIVSQLKGRQSHTRGMIWKYVEE